MEYLAEDNRFAQILQRTHADLYALLERLKSQKEDTEFRMGRRVKPATKMDSFAESTKNCIRDLSHLQHPQILDYLAIVGHNIPFEWKI